MARSRRLVLAALCAAGLWFLLHTTAIIWDGLHDELHPADVAVILGNKVERSGVPCLRLQDRLECGLALYRQGLVRQVIVSGGLGREGFYEAEVMRDYLVARGVPEQDVVVDNDGIDTYHTALNARRIMVERGWRSAVVVSQYFHIPRTRLAFRRMGIDQVYGAHARLRLMPYEPYNLAREFVAYYYYLLRSYEGVS